MVNRLDLRDDDDDDDEEYTPRCVHCWTLKMYCIIIFPTGGSLGETKVNTIIINNWT